MTFNELRLAINQPVILPDKGLEFLCIVKDVRMSYGKPQFLLEPIGGAGRRWVEFTTIRPCTLKQRNNIQAARKLLE